jgi:hypothetical protein
MQFLKLRNGKNFTNGNFQLHKNPMFDEKLHFLITEIDFSPMFI